MVDKIVYPCHYALSIRFENLNVDFFLFRSRHNALNRIVSSHIDGGGSDSWNLALRYYAV